MNNKETGEKPARILIRYLENDCNLLFLKQIEFMDR